MKKICLFLMYLITTSTLLFAKDSIANDSYSPTSASSLAKSLGVNVSEPLVIGDIKSVKAGLVPLADTIPVTYGKRVLPSNVPPSPPPAQLKQKPKQAFDAFFFNEEAQYGYKTILYERLIQDGESNRYKFLIANLKYAIPDMRAAEEAEKNTPKKVKPNKPRNVRPAKKTTQKAKPKAQRQQRSTSKYW